MTTPITTTTQLGSLKQEVATLAADLRKATDAQFSRSLMIGRIKTIEALIPDDAPAPTVKPGRDEVLAALLTVEAGPSTNALTDAVLAILPGKTIAQVRAEALRDAANTLGTQLKGGPATASSGYVAIGKEFLGALDRLADEEARK